MSAFPDKICSCCKEPKPATREHFKPLKAAKDGLSSWCRKCTSTDAKRAYAQLKLDPIAYRARQLRLRNNRLMRVYGISGEEYDRRLAEQDGCCAICRGGPSQPIRGGEPIFYVDHDHVSGVVRGLLCHSCNTLLGNVQDQIEILRAAISYLARQQSTVSA